MIEENLEEFGMLTVDLLQPKRDRVLAIICDEIEVEKEAVSESVAVGDSLSDALRELSGSFATDVVAALEDYFIDILSNFRNRWRDFCQMSMYERVSDQAQRLIAEGGGAVTGLARSGDRSQRNELL